MGQGASTHVGQRCNFNRPVLQIAVSLLRLEDIIQGIVKRTQVGCHLLLKVTRQKTEGLSRFDGGPGQYNPSDLSLL